MCFVPVNNNGGRPFKMVSVDFIYAQFVYNLRTFKIETALYKALNSKFVRSELKKKNPDFELLKKLAVRSRVYEKFLTQCHDNTFLKPIPAKSLSVMDQIFEMIMKEARSREGKNPVSKISSVLLEINAMVFRAVEIFEENERKEKNDEKKS